MDSVIRILVWANSSEIIIIKKKKSPLFLHQAEGVQVVTVCGLPVCSRAVCEDEDPDGRRQQGPREALHRGRGPRRPGPHAG